MRVTLLGTGGPRPDPTREGPATLVQTNGLNLVFDAGRGVASQLVKAGVRTTDIDAVFVTHHHFDHIGGLGDLIMSAWNIGRASPLPVFGPPGTADIIDALFNNVYDRDINFRIVEEAALGITLDHPSAMVDISEQMTATIELAAAHLQPPPVRVVVGEVEHGTAALGFTVEQWATVGYRIEADDRVVAISGDAVAGKDLQSLAAGADVFVMCAYLAADEIESDSELHLVHHVLAGAPQAAAVAVESRVRRLVLTHIREKPEEAIDRMRAQVSAVFDGEVIVGHDLLTIDA